MHRRSVLLAIASAAVLTPAGRAAPGAAFATVKPGVLTIGTYFVNPPFEYIADGRRVGFEVDLLDALARRLGLRPDFVETRWEVILGQQGRGLYDCIVGGITITPSRAKMLAFTTPYLDTSLSLVIDAARTPQIRSFADLKSASVAVQAATTDDDAAVALRAEGLIGSVRVYPFDKIADAMADLAAGRVTAVMKVAPVAAWLARRTAGLRIVAQVPDDPQPLGIGLRLGNAGLRDALDAGLARMKADGTFDALASRWGIKL